MAELNLTSTKLNSIRKKQDTIICRLLLDDVERTAEVKLDPDQGYVILVLNDLYGTEIRFDWATIEELAKKMKEASA